MSLIHNYILNYNKLDDESALMIRILCTSIMKQFQINYTHLYPSNMVDTVPTFGTIDTFHFLRFAILITSTIARSYNRTKKLDDPCISIDNVFLFYITDLAWCYAV